MFVLPEAQDAMEIHTNNAMVTVWAGQIADAANRANAIRVIIVKNQTTHAQIFHCARRLTLVLVTMCRRITKTDGMIALIHGMHAGINTKKEVQMVFAMVVDRATLMMDKPMYQ